jgi:hypothetical protein
MVNLIEKNNNNINQERSLFKRLSIIGSYADFVI